VGLEQREKVKRLINQVFPEGIACISVGDLLVSVRFTAGFLMI
jgi:hypothetical protein